MFKQLLNNKKIVIVAIAVILALIVGIVILVTPNTKDAGGKDTDTKTEQSKGHAETHSDKDEADVSSEKDDTENQSSGLEVLKPDEVAPENSSDASGSWDKKTESNTQTGSANTTDNENPNETDKKDDDDESEKEEDVLIDDIDWGNIY